MDVEEPPGGMNHLNIECLNIRFRRANAKRQAAMNAQKYLARADFNTM